MNIGPILHWIKDFHRRYYELYYIIGCDAVLFGTISTFPTDVLR